MPEVIIDGITYVPKLEIKPLDDKVLNNVLEVLTEMRYFDQNHKMKALAWNAINFISPDLAKLDPEVAFDYVRNLSKND